MLSELLGAVAMTGLLELVLVEADGRHDLLVFSSIDFRPLRLAVEARQASSPIEISLDEL